MSFGILIIGPSGSGKSTLSAALQELYNKLDISTTLINLDFANQSSQKYKVDIDINELISIEDVMDSYEIGPNAAMLYCMQFLAKNVQWLIQKLTPSKGSFFIFDLPGQIQLYINHDALKNIIAEIKNKLKVQLCIVELFDATYLYDIKHFLSLCLMSLSSMVNFQMPHINVISKIDTMKGRRPGADLQEYLNTLSTQQMVEWLNAKPKDANLLTAISKIIDSYGLVSFLPLNVQSIELLSRLVFQMQKALGSLYSRQNNKKYKVLLEQFYKDLQFHNQQLLLNLQNELFGELEQQQYNKFLDARQQDKH